MDMDEIAFSEWGAGATGTTLTAVSRSWHKTKSHICPNCKSFMDWLNLEKYWRQKKMYI
jgi:hypothetical protein